MFTTALLDLNYSVCISGSKIQEVCFLSNTSHNARKSDSLHVFMALMAVRFYIELIRLENDLSAKRVTGSETVIYRRRLSKFGKHFVLIFLGVSCAVVQPGLAIIPRTHIDGK